MDELERGERGDVKGVNRRSCDVRPDVSYTDGHAGERGAKGNIYIIVNYA